MRNAIEWNHLNELYYGKTMLASVAVISISTVIIIIEEA